jgi:hypothetical protein
MRLILSILVLFATIAAFAQSEDDLSTYGITKMTETTVKYENGQETERYISEYEMYDDEGEWVEKVDLLPNGDLKRREKRSFKDGEVAEEIEEEPFHGTTISGEDEYKRTTYKYDKDDEVIEEKEFNNEGELVEIKEIEYNKYGDKSKEINRNAKGQITETEEFSYNNKGFKEKKEVYNGSGQLIETKLYTYE